MERRTMGVDLARFGPAARSMRRWSSLAFVGAALFASFGVSWLVLGVLLLIFPDDLTRNEQLLVSGMVLLLGGVPLPLALGLLGLGWWGRRRLDRLRKLAALVRRRGVLDKREVERELGIGAGARRKLVERALTRGILETQQLDLGASSGQSSARGETIGGAYEVEGVLYVGRSGPVYRVRQIRTGQRYALKRLVPGDRLPEAEVERIAHLALTTTELRHPNLVQVHDVDQTTEGETYLVMELLEGESAGARVARQERIPWPDAVRFTHQVAAAMVAVHGTGLYHGGLSLAEVFLTTGDGDHERAVLTPLGPAIDPAGEDDRQGSDVRAVVGLLTEMLGGQTLPDPLAALLDRGTHAAGGGFDSMEELRSALAAVGRSAP